MVRRSDLSIAAFVVAVLAGTLLAAPDAGAVPLVFTTWLAYLVLSVQSRRVPERVPEPRRFGTLPDTHTHAPR